MNIKKLYKKGLTTGTLQTFILFLVLVTVLFNLAAELIPVAQTAGNTLNATGVPLGTLFVSGGIVFLIIMAMLLLRIVKAAMGGSK